MNNVNSLSGRSMSPTNLFRSSTMSSSSVTLFGEWDNSLSSMMNGSNDFLETLVGVLSSIASIAAATCSLYIISINRKERDTSERDTISETNLLRRCWSRRSKSVFNNNSHWNGCTRVWWEYKNTEGNARWQLRWVCKEERRWRSYG